MKFTAWTKPEICKLFEMVAKCKAQKKPVLCAFKNFGTLFGRQPLSVRNFYYTQLKIFEKDKTLAKQFGVELEQHKKNKIKFFSESELKESMSKIDVLQKQGLSVRSACLQVAKGDASKMLRLQNKFRSVQKKDFHCVNTSNVLVMPTRNGLSDNDINSLMLGIIKLVKKSAEENAEKNFENMLKNANFELRKSIKTLADKEREYELLRKNFEILTSNNAKLTEEVQLLRTENVELKHSFSTKKMANLKTYIKNLGTPLVQE